MRPRSQLELEVTLRDSCRRALHLARMAQIGMRVVAASRLTRDLSMVPVAPVQDWKSEHWNGSELARDSHREESINYFSYRRTHEIFRGGARQWGRDDTGPVCHGFH